MVGGVLAGIWVTYTCVVLSERRASNSPSATVRLYSRRRARSTSRTISDEAQPDLADPQPQPQPQPEPEPRPRPEPEPEPEPEPYRAQPDNATEGATSDASTCEERARNRASAVGVALGSEDGVLGSAYTAFLVAFIRDAVVTARCASCLGVGMPWRSSFQCNLRATSIQLTSTSAAWNAQKLSHLRKVHQGKEREAKGNSQRKTFRCATRHQDGSQQCCH
eukprot:COSAG02_NODE_68_length_42582_cov_52.351129_25_plen_221_part_00